MNGQRLGEIFARSLPLAGGSWQEALPLGCAQISRWVPPVSPLRRVPFDIAIPDVIVTVHASRVSKSCPSIAEHYGTRLNGETGGTRRGSAAVASRSCLLPAFSPDSRTKHLLPLNLFTRQNIPLAVATALLSVLRHRSETMTTPEFYSVVSAMVALGATD